MKSQHNIYRLVVIFFLTFIGCQDDEEPQYIGLPINTAQDSIVVNQGESIQISILDNDTNVSDSGTLSVSIPLEGSASIDEGLNTESVLDNTILYVANDTFVGDIEMTYTICNNATDCSTEMASY
jgi:hypothetical protein